MASSKHASLLLLLAAVSNGFQIGGNRQHHMSSKTIHRRMPPLHYKDIDDEISSITVAPPDIERLVQLPTKVEEECQPDDIIKPVKRIRGRPPKNNSNAKQKKEPKAYKPHAQIWQQRYNELKEYIAEHGHAMVPQRYPILGLWVMQQRRQYKLLHDGKRSSLVGEDGQTRIETLEDIGFVWRVERGGPRGTVSGGLRKMKHRADTLLKKEGGIRTEKDEIIYANSMVEYLIEKKYTNDEIIVAAWQTRYELFK